MLSRATLSLVFVTVLGTTTKADDLYRPRPGDAYGPATYCNWNRTGLPKRLQDLCIERDRRNPPKLYQAAPGETLTPLIPHCDERGSTSCNDDLFQPVWKRIDAENGLVVKIDMNSIERLNTGSVYVVIYSYIPNTRFDPTRLKKLVFDCQGEFSDTQLGVSAGMQMAPPRSLMGDISSIACNVAQRKAGPVAGATSIQSPNETVAIRDDAHKIAETKSFKAYISGRGKPIIYGDADLPDGNIVVAVKKPWLPDAQSRLARGLPACRPDCTPVLTTATVKERKFESSPISFSNEKLESGEYTAEFYTSASIRSEKPDFKAKFQILPDGEALPAPFGCAPSAGITNGC